MQYDLLNFLYSVYIWILLKSPISLVYIHLSFRLLYQLKYLPANLSLNLCILFCFYSSFFFCAVVHPEAHLPAMTLCETYLKQNSWILYYLFHLFELMLSSKQSIPTNFAPPRSLVWLLTVASISQLGCAVDLLFKSSR